MTTCDVLFLLVSSPKGSGQFGPKEEPLKYIFLSVISYFIIHNKELGQQVNVVVLFSSWVLGANKKDN